MTLTMVHPYFGHLVRCHELDGEQHEHKHTFLWFTVTSCWNCDYPVLECLDCAVNVSCCPCGNCHAVECEWPL